jgi:hypothetical protein
LASRIENELATMFEDAIVATAEWSMGAAAGLSRMAQYRLYCRNGRGRFSAAHDIDAGDDSQALAKAKAMQIPTQCELWERGRMVAKLDPQGG